MGEREATDVGADTKAASRVIARLVVRLASRRVPAAELIAAGERGLVRARELFQPDHGMSFVSVAEGWCRAFMIERMLDRSLMEDLPAQERRQVLADLGKSRRLLDALGVTFSDEIVGARLGVGNARIDVDGELDSAMETLRRRALVIFGGVMQPAERLVLEGRLLAVEPASLAQMARAARVSPERMRRIERRVIRRLGVGGETPVAEAARGYSIELGGGTWSRRRRR